MLLTFIWFDDIKKCKVMVIIISCITVALLLGAGISAGTDFIKVHNYQKVLAEVTENNFDSGGDNNWTKISYQLNGAEYITELDYCKVGYRNGVVLDFLVDPKHPENIVEANSLYVLSSVFLIITVPFAFMNIIYLINYAVLRRSQRRNQKTQANVTYPGTEQFLNNYKNPR